MGQLTDLLQAATGEKSLHSALGRWRLALSSALDNLDQIFIDLSVVSDLDAVSGPSTGLLNAAAGEVALNSAIGRWKQAVSTTVDTLLQVFGDIPQETSSQSDILDLLQASTGEESLSSAIGHWRQSVSQATDRLIRAAVTCCLWSFENNTNSVQVIDGVSLFGSDLTRTITIAPNQKKIVAGFDPRFVSLLGNFYHQTTALTLGKTTFGQTFAIRTHMSLGPSPNPINIRATFAAGETLSAAEVATLIAIGLNGTGSVVGIIENAETPQYDFHQLFTSVDPAGTWIDFRSDTFSPRPVDPRNGQIHLAIGYTDEMGPGNTAVPINVRFLPFFDLCATNHSPANTYVDDTWQRLPDGAKPRHSSVLAYLSDDRVNVSHGSEHPFCEPFASLQTSFFNPDTLQVVDGPPVTTPRFDVAFTEKAVLCGDGKHRTYVGGGITSNDEVLNLTMIQEAFTEENNAWDSSIRLHYQGPFLPNSAGIVDGFGNLGIPWGANVGPVAGLPSLTAANIMVPPAIFPGAGPIPPGQYYWTTATNGPFPPQGFDFGLLFTKTMSQRPSGPPGAPLAPNTFVVDPVGQMFWFSAANAAKLTMTVTPYRVKPVSIDAPDGLRGIRAFFAADVILPPSAGFPNGRWMIVGGLGSRSHPEILLGSIQATPEIYDFNTGTWADAAPMPVPVLNEPPCGVVHPNGNVYVVGGQLTSFLVQPTPTSNKTQIYNIATDTWSLGADVPVPGLGRACRMQLLDDGDLLVFGGTQDGFNTTFALPSPATWRYNPPANTWTRVGDMITAIGSGWPYKTNRGEVVMAGGSQHGQVQGDRLLVRTVQIFDPRTNTWFAMRDSPCEVPTHWYRAVLLDSGKLIYSGGIATVLRNNLQGQPSPGLNLYCPPRNLP